MSLNQKKFNGQNDMNESDKETEQPETQEVKPLITVQVRHAEGRVMRYELEVAGAYLEPDIDNEAKRQQK